MGFRLLPPAGPVMQSANLFFFLSALVCDLLLLRLFLVLAYTSLLLAAVLGYPGWPWTTGLRVTGAVSADGAAWALVCGTFHMLALLRHTWDERHVRFDTEEDEQLWRFFHRRCGMGRLQMKDVLKQGTWVRLPPGALLRCRAPATSVLSKHNRFTGSQVECDAIQPHEAVPATSIDRIDHMDHMGVTCWASGGSRESLDNDDLDLSSGLSSSHNARLSSRCITGALQAEGIAGNNVNLPAAANLSSWQQGVSSPEDPCIYLLVQGRLRCIGESVKRLHLTGDVVGPTALLSVFGVNLGSLQSPHDADAAYVAETGCVLYRWTLPQLDHMATKGPPALGSYWRTFLLYTLAAALQVQQGVPRTSADGSLEHQHVYYGAPSKDFTEPLHSCEEGPKGGQGWLKWLMRSLGPLPPPGLRHGALPSTGALARERVLAALTVSKAQINNHLDVSNGVAASNVPSHLPLAAAAQGQTNSPTALATDLCGQPDESTHSAALVPELVAVSVSHDSHDWPTAQENHDSPALSSTAAAAMRYTPPSIASSGRHRATTPTAAAAVRSWGRVDSSYSRDGHAHHRSSHDYVQQDSSPRKWGRGDSVSSLAYNAAAPNESAGRRSSTVLQHEAAPRLSQRTADAQHAWSATSSAEDGRPLQTKLGGPHDQRHWNTMQKGQQRNSGKWQHGTASRQGIVTGGGSCSRGLSKGMYEQTGGTSVGQIDRRTTAMGPWRVHGVKAAGPLYGWMLPYGQNDAVSNMTQHSSLQTPLVQGLLTDDSAYSQWLPSTASSVCSVGTGPTEEEGPSVPCSLGPSPYPSRPSSPVLGQTAPHWAVRSSNLAGQ